MPKPSEFIQYTNELYEKFVAEGKMTKQTSNNPDEKMQLSFNEIVLNASDEERDKLGKLLVAEAVKQGENKESVQKEWDSLVRAVVEGDMRKRATENVELPTVEDPYATIYHGLPNSYRYFPTPQKSKHQCTRKPKPKKRGVKHGNRKKK